MTNTYLKVMKKRFFRGTWNVPSLILFIIAAVIITILAPGILGSVVALGILYVIVYGIVWIIRKIF